MNLAVIIPSKTAGNLIPCVEAVRRNEPDARIVVVDDGLPPSVRLERIMQGSVTFVEGSKPFVYASNCNLGIQEAFRIQSIEVTSLGDTEQQFLHIGAEGVVLLNDDAILETTSGFSVMAQACREHPEYGIMSAVTRVAGNPQQFPKGIGLREAQRVVAFVCVYLPRSTFEKVGLLDERFGGVDERGRTIYGWDDNDMCRRIRNAGMKLGVHDGCVVDHGSLKSTFRGDPQSPGDIEPGRRVYMAKWGDCN